MYLPLICVILIRVFKIVFCEDNEETQCSFVTQGLFSPDAIDVSKNLHCFNFREVEPFRRLFKTSMTFKVEEYFKDCTSPIVIRNNSSVPGVSNNYKEQEIIMECFIPSGNICNRMFYHLRDINLDFHSITNFPEIFLTKLLNASSLSILNCNTQHQITVLNSVPSNEATDVVQYINFEEPIISLKIIDTYIYAHSFNKPLNTTVRKLVRLNFTALKFLDYDILTNLSMLEVADLSGNGLHAIDENLFLHNAKLETCDLSYNILQEIPPNLFKHAIALKRLRLDNNQLKALPPELFTNNRDLELLYLDNNQLRHLPSTLFTNNFKIIYLTLSHNRLMDLPRSIFPKNMSLEILNLGYNQLNVLNLTLLDDPEGTTLGELIDARKLPRFFLLQTNNGQAVNVSTLIKTNKLMRLNVTHNRLTEFPDIIFQSSQLLRYFDGSHNRGFRKFTNAYFLYSLEYLTLTDCNIEYIEGGLAASVLRDTTMIKVVEFSRNKLKGLSRIAFRNCRNLEMVFVKNNLLTHLETGLFKDLGKLFYLDLSNNMLSTLPSELFGLQNLVHLNVSRNYIKSFGFLPLIPLLQSVTSQLHVLDLSRNCLTSPEISTIGASTRRAIKLISVNMAFNALTDIPHFLVSGQAEIHLTLTHNAIRDNEVRRLKHVIDNSSFLRTSPVSFLISLCPNPVKNACELFGPSCEAITPDYFILNFTKGLTHIRLKICNDVLKTGDDYIAHILQEINLRCPFEPLCSKSYYQSLLCSENPLCDIGSFLICPVIQACPPPCNCYREGFEQNIVVNCSYKNLTVLPSFVPPDTEILHFEHNQLSNLSQFDSNVWSSLTELYLDYNQFTDIELSHLSFTVRKLSLKYNQIQSFDGYPIEEITHLQILLEGNPWICDCSALSFKTLLNTSNIVPDGKNILCSNSNYSLFEISEEELCVESLKIIINISLAMTLGILLPVFVGIISIAYYRNKQTIIAYVFTHHPQLFRCIYKSIELDERKRYDAFISYSGSDTNVIKQLIEQLEEKDPRLLLCIHERDWIPGDDISKNIANSVCLSRKTIIILSKEFLKSIWFSVELHSAYYQSMEDKIDRLIIVIKGELPPLNTLDKDLQVLLKTKTYLVWGERWFWEKMRYALSSK